MAHIFFHCQYIREFWVIFNNAAIHGLHMYFTSWEEVLQYAQGLPKRIRQFYFSLCHFLLAGLN
jgi:hypothetical protein